MRRHQPDLSYKTETADIIVRNFDPWQLSSRDEREPIHRLVNRVVSLVQESGNELSYVESMFFPDAVDLSEEWVMYRPYPDAAAADVFVSGLPLSGVVTEAHSVDEFISYYIDDLLPQYYISGFVSGAETITGYNIADIYVYGDGVLYNVDAFNQELLSSMVVSELSTVSMNVVVTGPGQNMVIREDFVADSVSVSDGSGIISATTMTIDDLTGVWNPDFDINGDQVIDHYESGQFALLYGKSMADFTPDEWTIASWADVNGNGRVDDLDRASFFSSVPSAAPDVYGVITFPGTFRGVCTVEYERNVETIAGILSYGSSYKEYYTKTVFTSFADRFAYDDKTGIYFGILGDRELRAFTYEDDIDEVTSDVLIVVDLWSSSCRIVDLDVSNGILYLLVTDGSSYRVYYGDVRQEYVDFISESAVVHIPSGFTPHLLTVTDDGYVVLANESVLYVFKPVRNRFIEIDGIVYTNQRYSFYTESGDPYVTIPEYIFNNLDSFAYGFGIERPWGCDNFALRQLIFDIYRNPPDNSRRGMNNGIMRELGYTTSIQRIPSGIIYEIPICPVPTEDILVNLHEMTVISCESDTVYTLSGQIGTVSITGTSVIPDAQIAASYDTLSIYGTVFDDNGDQVTLTQNVTISSGDCSLPLRIGTLGESDYLEEFGYTVDSIPTESFITIINRLETASPFVYENAVPDETPMDLERFSMSPVIPTIYDADIEASSTQSLTFNGLSIIVSDAFRAGTGQSDLNLMPAGVSLYSEVIDEGVEIDNRMILGSGVVVTHSTAAVEERIDFMVTPGFFYLGDRCFYHYNDKGTEFSRGELSGDVTIIPLAEVPDGPAPNAVSYVFGREYEPPESMYGPAPIIVRYVPAGTYENLNVLYETCISSKTGASGVMGYSFEGSGIVTGDVTGFPWFFTPLDPYAKIYEYWDEGELSGIVPSDCYYYDWQTNSVIIESGVPAGSEFVVEYELNNEPFETGLDLSPLVTYPENGIICLAPDEDEVQPGVESIRIFTPKNRVSAEEIVISAEVRSTGGNRVSGIPILFHIDRSDAECQTLTIDSPLVGEQIYEGVSGSYDKVEFPADYVYENDGILARTYRKDGSAWVTSVGYLYDDVTEGYQCTAYTDNQGVAQVKYAAPSGTVSTRDITVYATYDTVSDSADITIISNSNSFALTSDSYSTGYWAHISGSISDGTYSYFAVPSGCISPSDMTVCWADEFYARLAEGTMLPLVNPSTYLSISGVLYAGYSVYAESDVYMSYVPTELSVTKLDGRSYYE